MKLNLTRNVHVRRGVIQLKMAAQRGQPGRFLAQEIKFEKASLARNVPAVSSVAPCVYFVRERARRLEGHDSQRQRAICARKSILIG